MQLAPLDPNAVVVEMLMLKHLRRKSVRFADVFGLAVFTQYYILIYRESIDVILQNYYQGIISQLTLFSLSYILQSSPTQKSWYNFFTVKGGLCEN
jgi:hypothetical protein